MIILFKKLIRMKREKLYLDKSVVSAYYDRKNLERQKITIRFWKEILPCYQVFISEVTVEELNNTRDNILRRKFRNLIKGFRVLKNKEKIKSLAKAYIKEGIFPEKYFDDALHVGICSFYNIPYLVSWNFEHLVKVKQEN